MNPNKTKIPLWIIYSILFVACLGMVFVVSFPSNETPGLSLASTLQSTQSGENNTSENDMLINSNIVKTPMYNLLPTTIITPSILHPSPEKHYTETPDDFKNIYHIVSQTETLNSIAVEHGITIDELRKNNWMHGNAILPGQRLLIFPGMNWIPEHKGYSILKGDLPLEMLPAYPSKIEREYFQLHFVPQTYPAVDPEAIANLFENGLRNDERIFGRDFPQKFDIFVAGEFFEIPNQYLRGHSFGKDLYIVFLHDGSGDAVDQQYLASHEMTHFYMWNTFGQPTSYLLSEGTAVYAAKNNIANSDYIQLEQFCKGYEQAGRLPRISDKELSYKGQNYDLENYYAAGCFVKYLVDTYGADKLGEVYPTDSYESVYGKSLLDLESEWQNYLHDLNIPLPFDVQELINLNEQLKTAYQRFFTDVFTSPEMVDPYIALDKARLAMLSLHFDAASNYLKDFNTLVN